MPRKGKGKAAPTPKEATLPAMLERVRNRRTRAAKQREEEDDNGGDQEAIESPDLQKGAVNSREKEDEPVQAHGSSSSQSIFSSSGALTSSRQARDLIMDPYSNLALSLSLDELLKRLKVACAHFQNLQQKDKPEDYEELVPFCLHIANEEFLEHQNKDVRILVACVIADVLRIFAPEAPYKEQGQIKTILQFLASQLEGLKDVRNASFKRYFYLLENLAFVKTFAMTFEMGEDEGQEILISLFEVVFSVVRDDHSDKLKSILIDLLSPLILEGQVLSFELVDVVFKYIVEPERNSKKSACQLAKDLIFRCADSLEPVTNSMINAILMGNEADYENVTVAAHVYDLIFQLYSISFPLVQTSLPQLEYKLRSLNETERQNAVSLCTKLFSDVSVDLARTYGPLWTAFIGRFNDISVEIRNLCVSSSSDFLLTGYTEVRKDVAKVLSERVHDADEHVRWNVVKSVIDTAMKDFDYVIRCPLLLDCVKDRTMDKKGSIRREALEGLGKIYKMFLDKDQNPPEWIHQRILQGYYLQDVEDRVLIERLFVTCLVPYKLEVHQRMVQLAWVCSTLEQSQYRAFIEIQKHLVTVRRHLLELANCLRSKSGANKEQQTAQLNQRILHLAKVCPVTGGRGSSTEFVTTFAKDLDGNRMLLDNIKLLAEPNQDCKTVLDNVNKVIKKLCHQQGQQQQNYANFVQTLLQRASSLLIDSESILSLTQFVKDLVTADENQEEDPLLGKKFPKTELVIEKTSNLLSTLAFLFPAHFNYLECLELLVEVLQLDHLDNRSSSDLLAALVYVGRQAQPVGQSQPEIMERITNLCQTLIEGGSPRQAKMAVRTLYFNLDEEERKNVFGELLSAVITQNLQEPHVSSAFSTAVVALGHLAFYLGPEFKSQLKTLISRHVVKGLLISPQRTAQDSGRNVDKLWVDFSKLPQITQSMIFGLKTMARWIIGQKNDLESASKTFKMLTAFIETGGTLNQEEGESGTFPLTNSEKAWLRLAAGCAMLKVAQQKVVGDQYTVEQFLALAQLMTDQVPQVRILFGNKLHKGLSRGIPDKCLPMDFMGLYCLGGWETDRKHKQTLKRYLQTDVKLRRDYIKMVIMNHPDKTVAQEHSLHLMPESMVAFAIAVLSHSPEFQNAEDLEQLKGVEKALWFVMEPLVMKNEQFSFGWYKQLLQGIKNRVNAVDPLDDQANVRMYTVCDVAFELLMKHKKMKGESSGVVVGQGVRIPRMYFKEHHQSNWENTRVYLSQDFLKEKENKRLSMAGRTPRTAAGTSKGVQEKEGEGTPKARPGKRGRRSEEDDEEIDASPTNAKRTRVEVEGGSDELAREGGSEKEGREMELEGDDEDYAITEPESDEENEEPEKKDSPVNQRKTRGKPAAATAKTATPKGKSGKKTSKAVGAKKKENKAKAKPAVRLSAKT